MITTLVRSPTPVIRGTDERPRCSTAGTVFRPEPALLLTGAIREPDQTRSDEAQSTESAKGRVCAYWFASSKAVSARMRAPAVASAGVMLSASLWLIPSLQGIKIIPVGQK